MANKPTKRDHYNALLAIDAVASNPELVAFIENELVLLAKKNERKSSKPSKNQVANANLMDVIYDAMELGSRYTVTEIHKMVPALAEFSGNKVSALVRGLKLDGRVIRTEEKGKAYFSKA